MDGADSPGIILSRTRRRLQTHANRLHFLARALTGLEERAIAKNFDPTFINLASGRELLFGLHFFCLLIHYFLLRKNWTSNKPRTIPHDPNSSIDSANPTNHTSWPKQSALTQSDHIETEYCPKRRASQIIYRRGAFRWQTNANEGHKLHIQLHNWAAMIGRQKCEWIEPVNWHFFVIFWSLFKWTFI